MVGQEEAGWQVEGMENFGRNVVSFMLTFYGAEVVRCRGIRAAKQRACGASGGSGAGDKDEGVRDHLGGVPKCAPGGATRQPGGENYYGTRKPWLEIRHQVFHPQGDGTRNDADGRSRCTVRNGR